RSGGGLRAAAAARRIEVDQEAPIFRVGQRVGHGTFGVGTVVSCEIVPGDQQVVVAFPGKGVKKLLQSFARLEPAD
ncbi:MAG: hypothetical protein Q7K37_02760, partial [Dehalococcoidia bacterium]|nr:hypothetical protein [Dehalococcoidia bacterium]